MKTPVYLIGLLLMLSACGDEQTPTEDNATPQVDGSQIELSAEQFNNGNFKIAKADSAYFYQQFRVTGMVDVPPENRASINSFFSGFVSETHLLIGDVVKKGDLLIKLQNPDFIKMQQDYAESASQLEFLEAEYQRKQNLLKDKVISEKVFQQTRSDYNSMKAKVEGQRKTLQLMNVNVNQVLAGNFSATISIYAPISGKISKLNISQGAYVQPNTMIMEILDTDHIHLELDVFEKDIMKVQVGDTLDFRVPELNDRYYKAYVKLIGAEVGDNRSVRIHAHPVDENETFAVGMFVEAEFKTDAERHLSLPQTAFAKQNEHLVVLRLNQKTDSTYKFDIQKIKESIEQNNLRALISENEYTTQDQFLIQGVFDLIDNDGGD